MVIYLDSAFLFYLVLTLSGCAIVSWFLKVSPGPRKEQVICFSF